MSQKSVQRIGYFERGKKVIYSVLFKAFKIVSMLCMRSIKYLNEAKAVK